MIQKNKTVSCVRFSGADYFKIQKDSLLTGQSIPSLLKNAYFKTNQMLYFLTPEEKRSLFAEIRRVTESLDIIREQAYSGLRAGFDETLTQLYEQMGTLLDYINGKYVAVNQKRK